MVRQVRQIHLKLVVAVAPVVGALDHVVGRTRELKVGTCLTVEGCSVRINVETGAKWTALDVIVFDAKRPTRWNTG